MGHKTAVPDEAIPRKQRGRVRKEQGRPLGKASLRAAGLSGNQGKMENRQGGRTMAGRRRGKVTHRIWVHRRQQGSGLSDGWERLSSLRSITFLTMKLVNRPAVTSPATVFYKLC